MSGTPRMTISAPRELMREFIWLCHRRDKSASEVVREFMQDFVDSRFAEIKARDSAAHELRVFDDGLSSSCDELARDGLVLQVAAARGPRGCGP